jgi:hypothetical protein
MASWPEGRAYLEQQRRRIPSSRFRRLHHNLPGAPQGAFYDQGMVERAIVAGRQMIEPQNGVDYFAFVDMSGGSSDDAVLGISHSVGKKAVLDSLISQAGGIPFDPRLAVARFAAMCHRYRCRSVHGDAYAGETFRCDFSDCGIDYVTIKQSKTELYEALEVGFNAGQIELLDIAKLRQQLLTLVVRGASIDHQPNGKDDWANAAAGTLALVNPDRFGGPEGWIRFYRDLPARLAAPDQARATAAPPTVEQEYGHLGFTQNGQSKPITDAVRVVAPPGNETSVFDAISGTRYFARIEDGERCFYMSATDAKGLLGNPMPGNLPWIEANRQAAAKLGRVPPPRPGVRISDVLQAARDAAPRHPGDRGSQINDTLRSMGRLR